jgi:hypothetical protein
MLMDLTSLRQSLSSHQANRLYLLQHVAIPSFSGILIDDGLLSVRLQTEAKLYDAARSDSYGALVRARSKPRRYAGQRTSPRPRSNRVVHSLPDIAHPLDRPQHQNPYAS